MPNLKRIGFSALKIILDLADVHKDKMVVSILGLFTCFEYGYAGKAYAKPNYRATREYLHMLYRMWVHDDYKEPTEADYAKAEKHLGKVKELINSDTVREQLGDKVGKIKEKLPLGNKKDRTDGKEVVQEETKKEVIPDEVMEIAKKAYKNKSFLGKIKKIISDDEDKPKKKRKSRKKKTKE